MCGGHQHEVAILDYDILILKLERQSTYSILDEDNANSELEILAMDWRFPFSQFCVYSRRLFYHGVGTVSSLYILNVQAAENYAKRMERLQASFSFWLLWI